MTTRNERARLMLQIERHLAARASLKTLLAAAEVAIAGHRRELRIVEARVTRGRQGRTR